MQVIYLKTSTSALHFEIQGNGWTKVYLESNKKSIELGAEVNYILFRKIRDFLNRKDLETLAGTIENIAVTHVVSLSEKHTSVYASTDLQKPMLFFQNSKGEIFAKMNLKSEEMKVWLEQLLLDLSP
jgi:hypothetical protein